MLSLFVQLSVFYHLTKVLYGALLEEADAINVYNVQDCFSLVLFASEFGPENVLPLPSKSCISQQAVSTVLQQSLNQERPSPQAFLSSGDSYYSTY